MDIINKYQSIFTMFTFIGNTIKVVIVGTIAVHCYLYTADRKQFDKLTSRYMKCPGMKRAKTVVVAHAKVVADIVKP